jgi:mRNA-degrading endonuclease RelE of RelBE toxin-antitoxin system
VKYELVYVIFDIEGKDIVVLRVGHRREIYKRR